MKDDMKERIKNQAFYDVPLTDAEKGNVSPWVTVGVILLVIVLLVFRCQFTLVV